MTTTLLNIKGNRKNEDYTFIGRPSVFGNPFTIGKDGSREEVVSKYREYFLKRVSSDPEFKRAVEFLRGKTLGCFCFPELCHGDVIIEWLDAHPQGE